MDGGNGNKMNRETSKQQRADSGRGGEAEDMNREGEFLRCTYMGKMI